ncbi:MAG: OmpH family outer membrane protein [Bacteroidota bacterium]|jgi:outer membrane protein|nr:OmpH family outer membrane protein [Haliscomenobacter sp.]
MRNIILLTAVVLMGVMGGNTLSAQKFGYLNSQAILAELPEVKQSEAELEALQKQLQKKGQTMLETLQADYQVMQKKVDSGELSPKMQEEEGKKLQVREEDLNKFQQEMMNTLQEKRNTLLKPIYDKLTAALKVVAQENGYAYIFDQSILLFSDPAGDVSALVKAKLTAAN